jgi:DNA-binding MarR family transcriptional regulator
VLVTGKDGLEDSATALRRGVVRLSRRMQLERPMRTVSLNQFSLLAHLARRGAMTVGELAALERAQPQSLTRPLAGLAEEGHVRRQTDPEDGRRVLVTITGSGLEVLLNDMRQRDSWLALAMTRLNDTERGVLVLAAEIMERISQDADTVALHSARPARGGAAKTAQTAQAAQPAQVPAADRNAS